MFVISLFVINYLWIIWVVAVCWCGIGCLDVVCFVTLGCLLIFGGCLFVVYLFCVWMCGGLFAFACLSGVYFNSVVYLFDLFVDLIVVLLV